jgi:hypothetical protein
MPTSATYELALGSVSRVLTKTDTEFVQEQYSRSEAMLVGLRKNQHYVDLAAVST